MCGGVGSKKFFRSLHKSPETQVGQCPIQRCLADKGSHPYGQTLLCWSYLCSLGKRNQLHHLKKKAEVEFSLQSCQPHLTKVSARGFQ